MALNVTISTLYLGTFADLDTDEGNNVMENPGALVTTYGSSGDPLYKHITDVTTNSPSGDGGSDAEGQVALDHSDQGTPDTISYDVGDGPVTTQMDSAAQVQGIITYNDGSTESGTFAVFQDQTGALFLTIWDTQTTLDDRAVTSFQITSVDNTDYGGLFQATRDDLNFVACFTDDAMIRTPEGNRRITALKVGDLVMTRDHGPQPIRWIGATVLTGADLEERKHLRPYRVKADCFGAGLPMRDLTLSPQHRLLTGGRIVEKMCGDVDLLIAVKHLDFLPGVRRIGAGDGVTYRHILLDRHEVIYANGMPTESMLIGETAARELPRAHRRELEQLFPDFATCPPARQPARRLGRGREYRDLTARFARRKAHGRQQNGLVLAPAL